VSPYLPGHPPKQPTSYGPALLQVALGLALLGLAGWAYEHAQVARATDVWAFNGLSAISAVAGVLWMPFALASVVVVVRNRRHRHLRT
jgi:hypothetical protein